MEKLVFIFRQRHKALRICKLRDLTSHHFCSLRLATPREIREMLAWDELQARQLPVYRGWP